MTLLQRKISSEHVAVNWRCLQLRDAFLGCESRRKFDFVWFAPIPRTIFHLPFNIIQEIANTQPPKTYRPLCTSRSRPLALTEAIPGCYYCNTWSQDESQRLYWAQTKLPNDFEIIFQPFSLQPTTSRCLRLQQTSQGREEEEKERLDKAGQN